MTRVAVAGQLRPEAPVEMPSRANSTAPGSSGKRAPVDPGRRARALADLEQVAEQAEAGDVGERVHARQRAELRARAC